jgi:hypothetical protein
MVLRLEHKTVLVNNATSFPADDLSVGSLQGRTLSTTDTTNTNSTSDAQISVFDDVIQLLRASRSAPPSFQRQTSILRNLYTSLLQSRDVEEVGHQIGLKRHEVLIWFDVEKIRRATWSLASNTSCSISPCRKPPAILPKSTSFLEKICLLRESFDQNHRPSKQEYLQLSRETCLDAIDVLLWFETEQDIQFKCLIAAPEPVQGFSMAETLYQSVNQGSGIYGLYDMPGGLDFDVPDAGDDIIADSMDLSQITTGSMHTLPTLPSISRPGRRLGLSNKDTLSKTFPCLSCLKHFRSMTNWHDHQKKVHFSKVIYECWEGRIDGSPCLYGPVLRADNLRTHLIKEHQHQTGRELSAAVRKRARKINNLYHEKCGFTPCEMDLNDFETSMKHIAEHISSGSTASQWIHACREKEHRLPPHSKESGCQNTMENSSYDRESDDENKDNDNNNNRYSRITSKRDQPTQSLSSASNQGTQKEAGRNQSQQSYESSDTITELTDSYSNKASQPTSPLTFGDTTSITIKSDNGIRLLSHINLVLQQPLSFKPDVNFRSTRFLGRSGLGFVERVVCTASSKIYARKTIRRSQMRFEDLADIVDLNEELETLIALRHTHLTQIIGSYTAGDFFYILISPVADESLASFFYASESSNLSQRPKKRKSLLLEWMSCLQSAMAYLHSQDIIHQNIKLQNILIKGDMIFLTDIQDFRRFVDQDSINATSSTARSMYYSPETVKYGILDAKSNTFSLGCVFAEILTCYSGKFNSHFGRFRARETGDSAYYLTLGRTHEWIDDILAPSLSSATYDLLFKALHNALIEEAPGRPNISEIQLGIQELLQKQTGGTTEVGDIFSELGLSEYVDIFLEQGFDTWDSILDITKSDL